MLNYSIVMRSINSNLLNINQAKSRINAAKAALLKALGFTVGEAPDMYTLVLNTDAPLIQNVLNDSESKTSDALKPIEAEIKGLSARQAVLRQEQDKKKPEEITQEEKDDLKQCGDNIQAEKKKKDDILAGYAKDNTLVNQLVDLALLQNGMLKGEALTRFVKRSLEMI